MKFITLLFMLAVIFFSINASGQQDTLAAWTFPSGSADSLVDVAISANASRFISCEYGLEAPSIPIDYTTNGSLGSPDKCAKVVGLDNGADSAFWMIKFKSTGYENLKLYSKQSGGGNNPGPRDFKVQYKLSGTTTWIDIPNGAITCANDWTTGVLNGIDLPVECTNQSSNVSLRWIQTSNLDINGTPLLATGISKIDDIIITGDVISGINSYSIDEIHIYPNPSNGNFTLKTNNSINNIKIYNLLGKCIYQNEQVIEELIYFNGFEKGVYFVQFTNNDAQSFTSKLIVK